MGNGHGKGGETGARRHGGMVRHSKSKGKGRQGWKGRRDKCESAWRCGKAFKVEGQQRQGSDRSEEAMEARRRWRQGGDRSKEMR
jgi:hypothetical protein